MNHIDLAQRYIGMVLERQGDKDHPLIQWWLSLCGYGLDAHDEIPWCSAFVNGIAWECRLPRSKSAAARSWLEVGTPMEFPDRGDIIILKRGDSPTAGHVGIFMGAETGTGNPFILGGNQGNTVSLHPFRKAGILGFRRLTDL